MGSATSPAMSSERVMARRLGTSSPKISVRKVIRATARVLPITADQGCGSLNSGKLADSAGNRLCRFRAMALPMASPP
ncbi:hypothetical protein D9M71_795210 [compost metagenome]